MIAQVTLGQGQLGYFDGLSGIRLTPYQPTADVVYGMNTTQLEADVAAGKIVLVSGTLNTTLQHKDMGVYRKPATVITVEAGQPITPPETTEPTKPTVKQYTVHFDANGGTGTIADVKVNEKTDYTIPDNSFKAPADKQFKTFNDKKDGTGKAYAPKAKVQLTADLTLYAIWEDAPKQAAKVVIHDVKKAAKK